MTTHIPHSLDSVIEAVHALIEGRPVAEDWKPQAPVADQVQTTLLQLINGDTMTPEEMNSLTPEARMDLLKKGLEALRTKVEPQNLSPLEQSIADLKTALANISDRVGIIEMAILQAGQG